MQNGGKEYIGMPGEESSGMQNGGKVFIGMPRLESSGMLNVRKELQDLEFGIKY